MVSWITGNSINLPDFVHTQKVGITDSLLRGKINWWSVDSSHKGSIIWKMVPWHDVFMYFVAGAIYSQVSAKTTCKQVTTEVPSPIWWAAMRKMKISFAITRPGLHCRNLTYVTWCTRSHETIFSISGLLAENLLHWKTIKRSGIDKQGVFHVR